MFSIARSRTRNITCVIIIVIIRNRGRRITCIISIMYNRTHTSKLSDIVLFLLLLLSVWQVDIVRVRNHGVAARKRTRHVA